MQIHSTYLSVMAPSQLRKSQTKVEISEDENLPDSQQTSLDMLKTAREMVEAVCTTSMPELQLS